MEVNMGSDPMCQHSEFLQEAASTHLTQFAWNHPEHSPVQGTDVAQRPLKTARDTGTVCDSPSLICCAAFQAKLHLPL